MEQKISIAEHNKKRQEVIDAEKYLAEAKYDLIIAKQEFSVAENSMVVDNCTKCNGTGQVEFTGDPAHNPTGTTLHRICCICMGKGYSEENN